MTDMFAPATLYLGRPLLTATTEDGADAIASPAILAILRERLKQVERKGYTPAHDDAHDEAEIGRGALAYLVAGLRDEIDDDPASAFEMASLAWPWRDELFAPSDYADCLAKAGAMIAAELDRVIRARGQIHPVGEG